MDKWGVGWCVHRVVLVQAGMFLPSRSVHADGGSGFFHSLFLGGFSETNGDLRNATVKGKEKSHLEEDEWSGEDVELKFDDPNITRAAFEICLSRLYSPFPYLRYPAHLLPTAAHPLTLLLMDNGHRGMGEELIEEVGRSDQERADGETGPCPLNSSSPFPSLRSTHLSMSANTHLATPRLLLSLLATTIYLGQSPFMREVLATILYTIGPGTVKRYLGFAIGDGIGEDEWDGQTEEGARGLEAIGREVKLRKVSEVREAESEVKHGDENGKVGGQAITSRTISETLTSKLRGNPQLGLPLTSSHESTPDPEGHGGLPHFYGFASNEIGEACICFLARWGTEILAHELGNLALPAIFGYGGLPARFVAALLGSDLFWVDGEMERYRTARRILDLRRKEWDEEMSGQENLHCEGEEEEWDEDEMEIGRVFAEGIYYAHMVCLSCPKNEWFSFSWCVSGESGR